MRDRFTPIAERQHMYVGLTLGELWACCASVYQKVIEAFARICSGKLCGGGNDALGGDVKAGYPSQ